MNNEGLNKSQLELLEKILENFDTDMCKLISEKLGIKYICYKDIDKCFYKLYEFIADFLEELENDEDITSNINNN